jgi:hypothetical protein
MTATGNDGRDESADHDLVRLLPQLADRDFPLSRHLHHREVLMNLIDNETDEAAARPARPRLLRPAFLVPVTALALAGALAAGLVVRGAEDAGSRRGTTQQARQSVVLLDRIANAALATDTEAVKDNQFVYVMGKGRGADETSGKAVTGPLTDREIWRSQRQGPVKRLGLIREDGETLPINADLSDSVRGRGTPAGIDRPTYRWLASLPTDPDALLTYLYAKTPKTAGQERDQAVFDQIGALIAEQIMPPENAAALYKAAARIPGVTEAPDAVDAIGRRGIGIARDDTTYPQRSEWVFDATDLSYLGSRTYLTEDTSLGEAGTLLSSDAVLRRAVVDKAGERPAAAHSTAS